jgi:hypothetical protein
MVVAVVAATREKLKSNYVEKKNVVGSRRL